MGPRTRNRGANTPGPELTIVVPTRNEHDNVRPVYEALCRTLEGIDWETIFVDDARVTKNETLVRRGKKWFR